MSKFLVGHTYKSRDGKTEYTVVADGLEDDKFAVTYFKGVVKHIEEVYPNGMFREDMRTKHDLVPNTVKHVRWVNVYDDGNGNYFPGAGFYDTKQDAEDSIDIDAIATVPVEWESEE